jgi:hypothetical protein
VYEGGKSSRVPRKRDCVDHDYHGFANSLPDRPAKPKVLAEAELELDRLKPRILLCFFKEALVGR